MKLKIVPILTTILLLLSFSILGYRLFGWWQTYQKRKALFVYFQKDSPVTRRIPEDALIYINLFDFNRVHSGWQGTRFYDVLSHWLDTGMSDHAPNPVLGGMLEKTILNVIGNEFGFAIVPSPQKKIDFYGVAGLSVGSDFLLKIALASNKNSRKIEHENGVIYGFTTHYHVYPKIFVCIEEDFAYASSNLARLQQTPKTEGFGPAFLAKLDVEAIPQDTFLFARAMNPRISALIYGGQRLYHMKVSSGGEIPSHIPDLKENSSNILTLQWNGAEILKQPAASYLLEQMNGDPVSTLLLSFPTRRKARRYEDLVVDGLRKSNPPEAVQTYIRKGMNCYRYSKKNKDLLICSRDSNVFISMNEPALNQATAALQGSRVERLPLTLKIAFRREPILNYFKMIENGDWNRFQKAKEFYFLSCIKEMKGSIDRSQSEITVAIE